MTIYPNSHKHNNITTEYMQQQTIDPPEGPVTSKTTAKKTTAKKAPAKKTAAKKPADRQAPKAPTTASAASEFKKRKKGIPLPLPSGLAVLARRVDMQGFIKGGEVPNALMPIVEEALAKGQGVDAKSLMDDTDKVDMDLVREMYAMVENLVIMSVVEPKIYETPAEGEEEDDDLVYISDIDDEDKMFIYQWAVGGTDDIATFRAEAAANLASLA